MKSSYFFVLMATLLSQPVLLMAGDDSKVTGTLEIHEPKTKGIYGFGGAIGPEFWGSLKPPEGQKWGDCQYGKAQSPIDFSHDVVTKGKETPIAIHYKPAPAAIENLGTTLEVPYKNGSYIVINKKRYDLLQFHMHTPSEHTLNDGAHYPLEIHFVHQAKDGALAVLGVFVREGKTHPVLAAMGETHRLAQLIPGGENTAYRFEGLALDGEKLLPKKRSFYRYQGALTTPPCSEIVLWSVFETPIEMSADQINVLRNALGDLRFAGPEGQNNRPTQPVNGRSVTLNR